MMTRQMHLGVWLAMSLSLLLVGASLTLGQAPGRNTFGANRRGREATRGESAAAASSRNFRHLREGEHLNDVLGYFVVHGDQVTFYSEGEREDGSDKLKLIALPNLNLERFRNDSSAANRDVRWLISGTVTEYQDHNYILLGRVLKKASGGSSDSDAR
ncbi:MAG: hypothetical protein DWQ31_13030 [Planctomycetota bacterium]|nr:MAG: hypothetical protein DWQ31_13030 [Planctomycetota bacterium]REJ95250.1 MAG: hypothetical protein DWQ35_06850 [Planctomycetota bacterium]REK27024.1 MAG: hypothetical protein DWQ42_08165 [Planctomycetota bacterium]REK40323.1 MAG: hypothetical protein DWQ46_16755 [Planctomycetota bacterium]